MSKNVLKKIIMLFFIGIISCQIANASEFNFDNENYLLKFSKKSPSTDGYLNEYVRPNENLQNWTKLLGVYYYPRENSPLMLAKKMSFVVKQTNKEAGVSVIVNEKEQEAIVDFLTWPTEQKSNENIFLEFNVFRFKKDPKGGVIAWQYAKRYYPGKNMSLDYIKEDLVKQRSRIVDMMSKTKFPQVVEKDI